jgi:Flp pilus assembly pilin Flp
MWRWLTRLARDESGFLTEVEFVLFAGLAVAAALAAAPRLMR